MKRIVCIILILLITAALAACSPVMIEVEETVVSNSVHNTIFCLSIWAENSEYKTNEPINCFASVTYYGQEDTTIFHTVPLVSLNITSDGEHENYEYSNVLASTTFAPEQEFVFPFQKSGGWMQQSVQNNPITMFDEAIYGNEERYLPAGEYTLTAEMEYWTDEDDMPGTMKTLSASVTVTVE